jgi:hypothetical protein
MTLRRCGCVETGIGHEHHVGGACDRITGLAPDSVCRSPNHLFRVHPVLYYAPGSSTPAHVTNAAGACVWCSCYEFHLKVTAGAGPVSPAPGTGVGAGPDPLLDEFRAQEERELALWPGRSL